MNVQNIKKGFYTDGERIFSNYCGQVSVWCESREESEHWLASGNEMARFHDDLEVKPVKPGMEFYNGEIKVIDKNTIEALRVDRINPVYDSKGYCIKLDGYRKIRVIKKA